MKKISFITLIAILTMGMAGCRAKQQITTSQGGAYQHTVAAGDTAINGLDARLKSLAAGQVGWTSMQASGNVKVGGAQSFSSAMQMRMIRDKAIYISLRPLLGIEVGKIVITQDSLLVVDKYHKRFIAEPISLITNGIPITVSTMQDIFLGRAFILGSGSLSSSNMQLANLVADGEQCRLIPVDNPKGFTYGFAIDHNNHVTALEVQPTSGKVTTPYRASYSNVQSTLAGVIAHHAEVSANVSGTAFTLAIDMKNVTWNTANVNIDTSKPQGYKRMNGQQITSILESQTN